MSTTNPNQFFGWKPDLPDRRDHYFSALKSPASLPAMSSLQSSMPTAFNQFDLGSCTAQAVAGAMKYNQTVQKLSTFTASRLFIYYNTRVLEGTVPVDSGATLRNTIKSVNRWGAPPETTWTYNQARFAVKPIVPAYQQGVQHKAVSYSRLNQDMYSLQSCLADGFPFVFGFSVYNSFMSQIVSTTGRVPMPTRQEGNLGGHAVAAIGYNDGPTEVNGIPPRHFLVRNSWGPRWGVNGNFYMPYEYLLDWDLAADFWTIRLVS